MHHHLMAHDGRLVLLSFAVALLASYTALDMGTRLRRATGRARKLWLGGSSVVLGGGIWAMHFVAMLALDAGVPIGYDLDLTVISLLIAIAIMAVGLHLVTRANPSISRQLAAGCIVGCGVAIMHYTGMSAVIVAGTVHYDPTLVAASILIAIVAATVALWLTLNLTSSWQRVAAAVVMAIAVCGMHYTAMSATSIAISSGQQVVVDPLSRSILAAAVSIGLFLILCLAMVCVFADRRFEFLAEREAESLRAVNSRLRGEIEEREAIALELLTANSALTDTQVAIRNLLDNSDQGFLTVSPDLRVNDQASAACQRILGASPAGKPILDLLFPHDSDVKSAMRGTLESVFRDSGAFIRDLKLGLLPQEFAIDARSIRASYKFLAESSRLMLILTDVTQTASLTEAVEREHQRLEMMVLAFTERDAFAALVNDYQLFLADELPRLLERLENPTVASELYRSVHTYKGLLAQYNFYSSPRCLHQVETRLSAAADSPPQMARDLFGTEALLAGLTSDMASVIDVLGADFLSSGPRVLLSRQELLAMEQVARNALASESGPIASPPLRQLLRRLASLSLLDVKAALALHGRGMPAMATRLQKQLGPILVQGDDARLPPEGYGEFFRSLVHVFRNAVDHGIEPSDERVLAGKPAEASIRCEVSDHGGSLEILIEDDGRGVDRSILEDKLIASGEERPRVELLALEELVFREGLSSRVTVSEISGRGIGLAAVKAELDRLRGSVTVKTERGVGTRFRFRLPGPLNAPTSETPADRISA
jgi:NO-binding membrane sensor protein with MHYT domain